MSNSLYNSLTESAMTTDDLCNSLAESGQFAAMQATHQRSIGSDYYADNSEDFVRFQADRIIALRTAEQSAAQGNDGDNWQYELAYIRATFAAKDYAGSFNNDPQCFLRYVNMQTRHCAKLGHNCIAGHMQAVADDLMLELLA